MRFVYFTHSLQSCWNHGNAHFLRGVLRELIAAGHDVLAVEPAESWSRSNLVADAGPAALEGWQAHYPGLGSVLLAEGEAPDALVDGTDVVIVHEWTAPALVAQLGALRRAGAPWLLLFHDTHHRAVSEPEAMRAFDLAGYDAVLAFGEALAAVYRGWSWGGRVFVWHEAADTALFRPPSETNGGHASLTHPVMPGLDPAIHAARLVRPDALSFQSEFHSTGRQRSDAVDGRIKSGHDGANRQGAVWIGNWGDGERTAELEAFLLAPLDRAGVALDIHGVRYPPEARAMLDRYGARYHGWLPNHAAPAVFARHAVTVHVPRRFYATQLPGIPTIRVFEALACGIPLISAPWDDAEGLFSPGEDFLVAADGAAVERHVRALTADPAFAAALSARGLATVRARHSCAHRVGELLGIVANLKQAA